MPELDLIVRIFFFSNERGKAEKPNPPSEVVDKRKEEGEAL